VKHINEVDGGSEVRHYKTQFDPEKSGSFFAQYPSVSRLLGPTNCTLSVIIITFTYNLKTSTMNLQVTLIEPQTKDYHRALEMDFYKHGMRNWFYGNGSPIQSLAEKQSKLIKDPVKLVRRAKAVVAVWGTRDYHGYASGVPQKENVWVPFKQALIGMGFNGLQIAEIERHRVDKDFLKSLR